jgi:LuxR family transcriptional regulator, maltose regulon positive regulatory protein
MQNTPQTIPGTSHRAGRSSPARELPGALGGVASPGDGARARVPSPRHDFVPRPRLVRRLLEDREASVVLIAAPAGYGKTSLLSEWAEQDGRTFASLTLDTTHNDPLCLIASIVATLEDLDWLEGRMPARLTGLSLAAESAGAQPSAQLAAATGTLLAVVGAARGAMVLVLDDVHLLHSGESLSLLTSLAAAMPPEAKLALASRTTPCLPLGRLRAERSLLALEARDLAMTPIEASCLLSGAGVDLDDAGVEGLQRQTEGWPAGLYLAAAALRRQPDIEAGLERFAGDEHTVSEYIREEVLAALPPESIAFLMRTSVLDRLSAGPCEAVLGEPHAGSKLRTIAAENLMVVALDEFHSGYRCHPLLRDVLRAELDRIAPADAAGLHLRASRWFADQGDIDEAVEHAVAAGDAPLTGQLLWAHASRYVMQGRHATVQGWLGAFSDEQLASCAPLALSAAHSYLEMGDLGLAERWARVAAGAPVQSPDGGDGASLAAGMAVIQAAVGREGVTRAGEDARRACELEDGTSPWPPICCLFQGVSHHLADKRPAAREILHEGVRRSVVTPHVESLCLSQLALMAAEDEDWEHAVDLVSRARAGLERHGLGERPTSALVFATSAWIWAREGRADEAKGDLRRATRLLAMLGDFIPWYEVEARIVAARASTRLTDIALARTLLSHASRLTRRVPDAPVFRTWLDDAWAEIDGVSAVVLSGARSLTIAELRILRFLPTHLSFREIGERLHVSTNTVKSQAHAVYGKLGAASRSEAVAHASALGLIDVRVS